MVNLVVLAKVPGVHEVQLVEPVALVKVPAGQAMQEAAPVAGWW